LVVHRLNFLGSPNIGIYALATDHYAIIPPQITNRKASMLRRNLKSEIIQSNLGGTRLIGVLAAANSHGMVVPHFVSDSEITSIQTVHPTKIVKIESKITAFGNLILANDHGGIVSRMLFRDRGAIKQISEALNIEVVPGEIAGLPYVGSVAVATNKGVLAHPMLRPAERSLIKEMLKVHVDVGTINGGTPFLGSGILANNFGVIIGNLTTGPEIMMVSNVLE
jgi:translation initiation factor 6